MPQDDSTELHPWHWWEWEEEMCMLWHQDSWHTRNIVKIENKTAKTKVEVNVCKDSIRQESKDGKQNTQWELCIKTMTIGELIIRFEEQLVIFISHYQEICWMQHLMNTNVSRLPPDMLLIFTVFAEVMCLWDFQIKNSSIDGHCANNNFVCIYNRWSVKAKEKSGVNDCEFVFINDTVDISTVNV